MNDENNNLPVPPLSDDGGDCIQCSNPCCGGECEVRSNLHSYNWLGDIPGGEADFDIVEVHFKNTRRGFYRNTSRLDLKEGDWVAVEANPGHDIGQVAMTGRLVKLQMRRANLRPDLEILRVFRKAKPADLERYEAAKAREQDTMIRSRKIAADLGLKMKIGDVEYQGDGNKAIFYYIADERVDFRQLIKVLAEVFRIRVEMKQIGARQEAGRIGGIGPCGRPLCCATWMTNFVSVATSAARFQDISLNPQKLAGQCAKLKCCINYEVDTYVEASKQMPPKDTILETKDAVYYPFKVDTLKGEITYSTDKSIPANLVTIARERIFEVMALNRNGVRPDKLSLDETEHDLEAKAFGDILGQDAINRFDRKKKRNKKKGSEHRDTQPQGEQPQDQQGGQPQQAERRERRERRDHERRERPQSEHREHHDRPRSEGMMPRNDMRRAPRPDRVQRNRQPKPNRREGRDGSQNAQNKG
jgi:cell fate regulator YaaT (PSP1 superfamily)